AGAGASPLGAGAVPRGRACPSLGALAVGDDPGRALPPAQSDILKRSPVTPTAAATASTHPFTCEVFIVPAGSGRCPPVPASMMCPFPGGCNAAAYPTLLATGADASFPL